MSERPDMPIVFPASLPEEPPKSGGAERRAEVRFPFTAAAEVYDLRSQTRVTGRCSDLGSGGCYVDTISPLTVSSVVRVRIERDLREFEAAATVAYAHVSMGMGLMFTEIGPKHQDILRIWIAELSGEQPPKLEVSADGSEAGLYDSVANMRPVLNELIKLLLRKKIITENEGADLLRQVYR